MTSGCRIAAMGDAGVALPIHAPSIYWNPAASGFLSNYEVWAEGAVLYGGLSKHAAGFLQVPLQQEIGVGIYYTPFFSGGIPKYDSIASGTRSDGVPLGYFRDNQHQLALAVAKRFSFPLPRSMSIGGYPLPLDIAAGLSFKGFWHVFDPDGTTRFGVNINCDLGVLVRVGLDYNVAKKEVQREVTLGATLKNALSSKVVWVNSPYHYEEPVYNSQYFGLAYMDRSGFLFADWIVALSMHRGMGERQFGRTPGETGVGYVMTYHAGIEAGLWKTVMLRAGVSDRIPELGVGISYRRFRLDYAFRFDTIASSPIRLGFGVYF